LRRDRTHRLARFLLESLDPPGARIMSIYIDPEPQCRRRSMMKDRLHRLLAVNAMAGAVLGLIIVVTLLVLDTAGLRRLISGDPAGYVALAMLCAGFIVTGASVLMGSAVMLNGGRDDDNDHSGPGGGGRSPVLVPVRVYSKAVHRR
jgi:hypothetical protein